jgi:hypothetical protein
MPLQPSITTHTTTTTTTTMQHDVCSRVKMGVELDLVLHDIGVWVPEGNRDRVQARDPTNSLVISGLALTSAGAPPSPVAPGCMPAARVPPALPDAKDGGVAAKDTQHSPVVAFHTCTTHDESTVTNCARFAQATYQKGM